MGKQTFTEIKQELEDLKTKIKNEAGDAKKRFGKKDFLQGYLWGAATVVILYTIKHFIF